MKVKAAKLEEMKKMIGRICILGQKKRTSFDSGEKQEKKKKSFKLKGVWTVSVGSRLIYNLAAQSNPI